MRLMPFLSGGVAGAARAVLRLPRGVIFNHLQSQALFISIFIWGHEMAFVGSAIMTREKARKAALKYVAKNSCNAFIYRRCDGTFGFTCEVRGTDWAIVEVVK